MATRSNKHWAKAKSKSWKKNFAPKRQAWYAPLGAEIESHLGITAILLAAVFFFGGVFSLESAAQILATRPSVPMRPADGPESQLAASAAYINHLLHVPSGYTDSAYVPPPTGN